MPLLNLSVSGKVGGKLKKPASTLPALIFPLPPFVEVEASTTGAAAAISDASVRFTAMVPEALRVGRTRKLLFAAIAGIGSVPVLDVNENVMPWNAPDGRAAP